MFNFILTAIMFCIPFQFEFKVILISRLDYLKAVVLINQPDSETIMEVKQQDLIMNECETFV